MSALKISDEDLQELGANLLRVAGLRKAGTGDFIASLSQIASSTMELRIGNDVI